MAPAAYTHKKAVSRYTSYLPPPVAAVCRSSQHNILLPEHIHRLLHPGPCTCARQLRGSWILFVRVLKADPSSTKASPFQEKGRTQDALEVSTVAAQLKSHPAKKAKKIQMPSMPRTCPEVRACWQQTHRRWMWVLLARVHHPRGQRQHDCC